jgi:hypothetical protein
MEKKDANGKLEPLKSGEILASHESDIYKMIDPSTNREIDVQQMHEITEGEYKGYTVFMDTNDNVYSAKENDKGALLIHEKVNTDGTVFKLDEKTGAFKLDKTFKPNTSRLNPGEDMPAVPEGAKHGDVVEVGGTYYKVRNDSTMYEIAPMNRKKLEDSNAIKLENQRALQEFNDKYPAVKREAEAYMKDDLKQWYGDAFDKNKKYSIEELSKMYLDSAYKLGDDQEVVGHAGSPVAPAYAYAVRFSQEGDAVSREKMDQMLSVSLIDSNVFDLNSTDALKKAEATKEIIGDVSSMLNKYGEVIIPMYSKGHAMAATIKKNEAGQLEFRLQNTHTGSKPITGIIKGDTLDEQLDNIVEFIKDLQKIDYRNPDIGKIVLANGQKLEDLLVNPQLGEPYTTGQIKGNCYARCLDEAMDYLYPKTQEEIQEIEDQVAGL